MIKYFPSVPCRTLTLLCLCLSFTLLASGQYKEWWPIPPEELQAKDPIVEPEADAEALFWEMRIDDSSMNDLDMWHYVRVKIFTERGREKYSKFDIPYIKGTKIKNLSARVTRPDGSSVEIGKNDIFDREIIKASGIKVKAKSFAVPNIEPGVIVEYKYKEAIDDAGASGMRLQLQRDIPVRSLRYYYKPYKIKEPKYQAYNISDFKFIKSDKGFWLAQRQNVTAFKEEPRMPPEDTVRPWLLLTSTRVAITDVSAFSVSFSVKDPSNPRQYWGSFAGEKASSIEWALKSNKEIKRAAEEITAGATDNDDKLRRLYEFVQRDIRNLAWDPKVTDEERQKKAKVRVRSISDVLERKEAVYAHYVDYLFAALASSLGMEARFVYTGDRSKMFFQPEMTNESLVHRSAIAIQFGNEFKFFAPSSPFLPFGMLPWHDEASMALLVGAKNFMWTDTPASRYTDNSYKRSAKLILNDEGTLEGDITVEISGQPALSYREANYDETQDKQAEFLIDSIKSRISTAEVTAVSVENVLDASKPVVQRYKIRVPNYAQKTGKRLFIQPGYFEYGPSALFSSATRQYGVFFQYPWSENDEVEIKLPEGFELDNADSPAPISDPQRISSLEVKMSIDRAARLLRYERKFHFGNEARLLFPAQSYQPLKTLFDAFHQADTHTLSLKQP